MSEGQLAILIPILVPIAVFTMIYFVNKQENETKRKMIENGMNPNERFNKTPTPGALKFGGLLIGGGLGLFLASIITSYSTIEDTEAVYFGLIALLGGIGLVVAHNIARKQYIDDQHKLNQ